MCTLRRHDPAVTEQLRSFLTSAMDEGNPVEMWWHTVTHGRGKWRGNKRMEWVASKRHMTAEHRLARTVQTLQADVHSSPASSQLNWLPCRFKWSRTFCRKTKSGFCACAITFQTQSNVSIITWPLYPQGKNLAYTLKMRVDGPQSWSRQFREEEKKKPLLPAGKWTTNPRLSDL